MTINEEDYVLDTLIEIQDTIRSDAVEIVKEILNL